MSLTLIKPNSDEFERRQLTGSRWQPGSGKDAGMIAFGIGRWLFPDSLSL